MRKTPPPHLRVNERRSSSRLFFLAAVGVIAITAAGCYGRARVAWRATVPTQVVVSSAPPPVEAHAVVTPAAAPSQDAVWVEGHYKWEGRWVWVDGHWEANRRGYVWVAPVADESGGQVTYYPGFWCPEGETPPPVYRRPGRVRVTVRPPTSGGATVSARPPSGGVTVTARPSGGTTVTARPSGGATVTARPSGGTTVTARPSGGTTVTARPSGGTTVTARPSGGASGETTVTPRPSGGATVTARPSGGVNRADPTPERAAPRPTVVAGASGASATGTAPRPSVEGRTQAGATGSAPSTTPGATQAGATGTAPASVNGSQVVVNPRPTGPGPEMRQPPLTCRIDTPRAPLNGLITVSGTFSTSARVMIGGESAVVVNRGRNQLRARVPGSSGGGLVRVIDGAREGSCGTLSISSR